MFRFVWIKFTVDQGCIFFQFFPAAIFFYFSLSSFSSKAGEKGIIFSPPPSYILWIFSSKFLQVYSPTTLLIPRQPPLAGSILQNLQPCWVSMFISMMTNILFDVHDCIEYLTCLIQFHTFNLFDFNLVSYFFFI